MVPIPCGVRFPIVRRSNTLEASSIELIVIGGFGSSGPRLQGLRFASFDSLGEEITGFNLDVSPRIAGLFGTDRITFGPDFVNVDFNQIGYVTGDRVTLNFQLTPTAVPEPASLVMLGTGALGLLGYGWRRRARRDGAARV